MLNWLHDAEISGAAQPEDDDANAPRRVTVKVVAGALELRPIFCADHFRTAPKLLHIAPKLEDCP
jgi:hypothetical protein